MNENKKSRRFDEKTVIDAFLANGRNISQTAYALDSQRSTVQNHVNRATRQGRLGPDGFVTGTPAEPLPAVEVPPVDPIDAAVESRKRSQVLRIERDLLREVASERSLRAFLAQLASDTTERLDAPPPYQAPKHPLKSATTETLLLQFSDWHAYEIVKRDRVLGLNEYDASTFASRVKTVVNGALSIKSKMERGGGWRFPNLVLPCNGDFVSGTIHEAERHADSPNIVMSVYGCARTMALAVRELASQFETVTIPCISGNHGRLPDARKMQLKDPTRSWDTLVYLIAKTALENVPNVKFLIPDAYQLMFDVGAWRFLQYHGQSIKSTFSIPYYGIDRWSRNMNALMTLADRPINYFILGHFHQYYTKPSGAGRGEILGNGSLIGGTEYGIEGIGAADIPCQGLYGVHETRGVTHRWPIMADDSECSESYPVYPWTADIG